MEATQYRKHKGATRNTDSPSQYLTFHLAAETYAVGILQVREILRYEELTEVPSTPDSIRGVLNLRGSVVPVVDLAVKFGLRKTTITKWTCIVIVETVLEGEDAVMGILTDSVSEVLDLREDDIEPPPPFGTKVHVGYLLGMGKAEKRFILILDIDKVLSAEDIAVAAETLDANEATERERQNSASDSIPGPVEVTESIPHTANEKQEEPTTKQYAKTVWGKSDTKAQTPTLSDQTDDMPRDKSDKPPKSAIFPPGKSVEEPLVTEKVEKAATSSTKENANIDTNKNESNQTQKKQ